jgi:hypothetical protein
MATELLLLPSLVLVLLCHHLDNIFAGFEEIQEVQEVEAHRAYLARRAHLDPHPAHYLQFHLHPDLVLSPDPDPVLSPDPVLNPYRLSHQMKFHPLLLIERSHLVLPVALLLLLLLRLLLVLEWYHPIHLMSRLYNNVYTHGKSALPINNSRW